MFDPRVAFSRCELHVSSKFAALKSFTRLSTLVDVEKCETLYTKASDDIKKVLSTSLNDESQARCAVELADIIAPLCREVLIENRYNGESFSPPIRMSSLGLGSSMTWHGCPDLRLRATNPGPEVNILISTSLPEDDEESEEEQDSDGDSINVEIKKNILSPFKNVRSQALATTVVASFINNNKHNITITPVLLMCKRHVYVCIYECVQDILFISESVKLSTDGVLCELGVAIIWVMLHCRCVLHESYLLYDLFCYTSFFRELFTNVYWKPQFKSTIQEKLEHINHLQHYKVLQETTVNWNAKRSHSDDEGGEVEIFPALKKQRTM